MKKGDKAAIVCCSNALPRSFENKLNALQDFLRGLGLEPVLGDCIYEQHSGFGEGASRRAASLMRFYENEEVRAIFDISGGDIANGILPYLDFEKIADSDKIFWGYSDLTTVINAIYAKTGRKSVLYQIRHLIHPDTKQRREDFYSTLLNGTEALYSFSYKSIQKEPVRGIVVGGNIRCLLKLAGTKYWPDMRRKILLLESFHGGVPQMTAYFAQLKQMGVFGQVKGILLGTFTEMEEKGYEPSAAELLIQYAGTDIPVMKTDEIGHSVHSKGIVIGDMLRESEI